MTHQPITDDDLDTPIVVKRGRTPGPEDPAGVLVATDVIRNPSLPWEVRHVYMLIALMVDDETRAGTFDRDLLDDLAWSDDEVGAAPDEPPRFTVTEALDRGERVGLWSFEGDQVWLHDADDRLHADGDRSVLPGVLPSPVRLTRRDPS